ncbi:hypothetical protein HIV01_013095 [Lysobacter arenosi]|jgi:hypothetical protein|uniref:Uncharacterized protein n=1 Tax=Lysobacter arenosi TaxID=2795387 RepID=A0ABX7R9Y7_9GAMM|nr:hypothetical protein [Lysobacter arenosi]QSX74136.1 hypothetical protein HIV01_013095 [Lysobacter arenosi]
MDATMMSAVALAVGSRSAAVRQIGVTRRTLGSFVGEFGRPPLVSFGAAYPIYRWFVQGDEGDIEVAVIDRGCDQVRILMSGDGA